MTARRIIVVVLAIAGLTIGMYAQGGGGRAGGGGGRGAGGAEPIQPGNLITGAWGQQPLKPDARGWGWMVK